MNKEQNMNIEQLRAEFEEWCREKYNNPGMERAPDGYAHTATHQLMPMTYASVQMLWEAYQAGRAALQSQDREDAERYRLLRRKVRLAGGEFHILNLDPRYIAQDSAAELDAAIDAAMQRSSGGDDE